MSRHLLYLVTIAMCCITLSLRGQYSALHFDRFTDADGLPGNMFTNVIQDRDGILWMSSSDGLARYDGYTLKTYRHNKADPHSISSNQIILTFEDASRRLWVALYGMGLNISDPDKEKFCKPQIVYPDTGTTMSLTIRAMAQDRDGNIWISGNAGLHILTPDDSVFICRTPAQFFSSIPICAEVSASATVFTDDRGRVWIGVDKGLCMYDPETNRMYCPEDFTGLPAGRLVSNVAQDREGRIWVSAQNAGPRMFYTAPGDNHFNAFDGVPVRATLTGVAMAFDMDNRLWASVFGEHLYAYDFRDSLLVVGDTSVYNTIQHERFMRQPFVDHSGNVWVPVEGYFIHRYPRGFSSVQHPFGFHQSASCIYTTQEDLWIGYREQGLVRINRRTGNPTHYSMDHEGAHHIPSNLIQAVLQVSSGNLIVIGFSHIGVMNASGEFLRSFPLGGSNRAIFEDSAQRIWIGGIQGLFLFSDTEGFLAQYKLPVLHGDTRDFVQGIVEDHKGHLWMVTAVKGLVHFNPATEEITQFFPVEGDPESLPSPNLQDITIDKDGILWIASDMALVRFDPKTHKAKSYGTAHGLKNDYIAAVQIDQSGTLWVSTHIGIASFDPASETFHNYDAGHGLMNNSFYDRACHLADDGSMYFGGVRGIDFFTPSALRSNPVPPRMYLVDCVVNTEQHLGAGVISDAGGVHLSHSDRILEFTFAALHYTAPERIRYMYRMDGLHRDWVDLGDRRSVLFSKLKAGEYVFRVRAKTIDDVWSEEDLTIPVYVAAPFWDTWWFRLLVICGIVALVYWYIRQREHNLNTKRRQEAEIQRKMSELEKRALQAQMNPHFIYNSMNSIQQFMIMRDFEGAMRYLTRFSRLLRTVLNMSAQNRIALSDEIKLIEDYIELENMRFPDKFSYEITVSPQLNIHSVEIPPFFIQPQVENAIRHGLLKKTTTGHLHITIDQDNRHLRVVVEDDGIGRDASRAAKLREGVVRESKGLAIMEERLSHLHDNGVHPLKVEDLYDAEQKSSGTRVEILLPLE